MANYEAKGKDYTPVYAYTITYNVFSSKKLVTRLKNLTEEDAPYFAERYNLPEELVKDKLIKYCQDCPTSTLKKLINTTLQTLKLKYNEEGRLEC